MRSNFYFCYINRSALSIFHEGYNHYFPTASHRKTDRAASSVQNPQAGVA